MTQFDSSTSSLSTPVHSTPSEHPPQVDYMDNALFKAARRGDIAPFNQYQGDLHCLVDGRQNTALHIYFRGLEVDKNKREISINFVKQLVGKCSSLLLQPNDRGEIPLHSTARKGDSDIVKILIELAKEDDEYLEKGLEVATLQQMLRLRDKDGNTAMHKAVESGDLDVVRLLMNELDPDFSFSANTSGVTPLYVAVMAKRGKLVDEILEIYKLNNYRSINYYGGPNGRTALHAAVDVNDEESVRKLIEANRPLTKESDAKGRTPLHYSVHGSRVFPSIAKLLQSDVTAAYITEEYESGTLYPSSQTEREKQIQQLLKDIPNDAEVEHLWTPNIIDIVRKVEEETKVQDIPKHEIEEKARESHVLVATLVATVTFVAAFTVPGGYKEQQGTDTLIRDSAFKAFIISNSLAFVASLSAITFHFISVMFRGFLKRHVTPSLTQRADQLTVFAIAAMVVAFSTGTYAVLQSSLGLAITALLFGLVFFPICVALFLFELINSLGLCGYMVLMIRNSCSDFW